MNVFNIRSNFLGIIKEQGLSLLIARVYDLNYLFNRAVYALDANPAKCRLAVGYSMRFFYLTYGMKHISYVIKTCYFS